MNLVIPKPIGQLLLLVMSIMLALPLLAAPQPRIAYLVSDSRIPFWQIMQRGIEKQAITLGYTVQTFSANNIRKNELKNALAAVKDGVDGIILSPIDSSNAVTILNIARTAGIPVVLADIGADSKDYVSYISSDNFKGANQLGQILVKAFQQRSWESPTVGIIAIPQRRENGRARTEGFLKAIEKAGFKSAGIRQQKDFSYDETYTFSTELIKKNKNLRALWLQGSDRYQAALDAISDAGMGNQILLLCFDAEPEFIEMLKQGDLLASGMQQPYLIGEIAIRTLHRHLQDEDVEKSISLPVLAVSPSNINFLLPDIYRNVLGMDSEK